MKKIISTLLFLVISTVFVWAQGTAQIYFEKTTHDFGIFYEDHPKVTCKFKFTNTGDGPLVIHQAIASVIVIADHVIGQISERTYQTGRNR